jgi:hypothetical protein
MNVPVMQDILEMEKLAMMITNALQITVVVMTLLRVQIW